MTVSIAYANKAQLCEVALHNRVKQHTQFSNLPSPYLNEISVDVKKSIEAHEIYKFSQYHDKGKNLNILISPNPNLDRLRPTSIGEEIQAHYVIQTLKHTFSDVDINMYLNSPKLGIKFKVGDEFEQPDLKNSENKNSFLSMALVKAANGLVRGLDKSVTRESMGISNEYKVVNFYSSLNLPLESRYNGNLPGIEDLSIFFMKQQKFDVFIYNAQPRMFTSMMNKKIFIQSWFTSSKILQENFDQLVFASELSPNAILKPRTLVINDTAGLAPYIYVASDMTVVAGTKNSIESVAVGTPTMIFVNKELQSSYGVDNYKKIIEAAELSGKAKSLSNISELSETYTELVKHKGSTISPELIKINGKSKLDLFLDDLLEKIKSQIAEQKNNSLST